MTATDILSNCKTWTLDYGLDWAVDWTIAFLIIYLIYNIFSPISRVPISPIHLLKCKMKSIVKVKTRIFKWTGLTPSDRTLHLYMYMQIGIGTNICTEMHMNVQAINLWPLQPHRHPYIIFSDYTHHYYKTLAVFAPYIPIMTICTYKMYLSHMAMCKEWSHLCSHRSGGRHYHM